MLSFALPFCCFFCRFLGGPIHIYSCPGSSAKYIVVALLVIGGHRGYFTRRLVCDGPKRIELPHMCTFARNHTRHEYLRHLRLLVARLRLFFVVSFCFVLFSCVVRPVRAGVEEIMSVVFFSVH